MGGSVEMVVAMNLSAPIICAFSLFQRSLPPMQRVLAQLLAANVSLKEINQENPLMREMTEWPWKHLEKDSTLDPELMGRRLCVLLCGMARKNLGGQTDCLVRF